LEINDACGKTRFDGGKIACMEKFRVDKWRNSLMKIIEMDTTEVLGLTQPSGNTQWK